MKAKGEELYAKRIANEIVRSLQPTLKKVAQRFSPSARGSLSPDDLVQVGAIEVLKFLPKYAHEKRGSQTFEDHLYRRAMRACVHQIQMHASDVRASLHAQRRPDTIKKKVQTSVTVESSDTLFEPDATENPTPEKLLGDAETSVQLREMIHRLPASKRELVRWVFGIGRPATSLRDIARQQRVPRSRLAADLEAALLELRSSMVEV